MRLRKARSEGHPGPVGGMSLEPEWLGTMYWVRGFAETVPPGRRTFPRRPATTRPVHLLVAPSQGPVPSLPLGAAAATVVVLAGMRLLWERDRPSGG